MDINIRIECSDYDEILTHLSVIRSEIKKKRNEIEFESDELTTIKIEDSNCYGYHLVEITNL